MYGDGLSSYFETKTAQQLSNTVDQVKSMQPGDLTGNDDFGLPVHVFNKSVREQVRISLNEFRGVEYIDIRSFYLAEDGFRPSPRGVTLRREFYPELFSAVVQLGETLGFDEESLLNALEDMSGEIQE